MVGRTENKDANPGIDAKTWQQFRSFAFRKGRKPYDLLQELVGAILRGQVQPEAGRIAAADERQRAWQAAKRGNPRTAAKRAAVVCVLRSGGSGARRYGREHALWLYRQARRCVLNASWEFVCLTDDEDLRNRPPPGPFRAWPLRMSWQGWWSKLEMFWPDMWADAQTPDGILYLDLDTVLRHPFWIPAGTPGTLRMLRAFTSDCAGWMSGAMLWHGRDDLSAIPEKFARHREVYEWCCRGMAGGDQEFIAMERLLAGKEVVALDHVLDAVRFDRAADKPGAALVPWFGSAKPWTKPTGFTPPLAPDASRVALVGAWFGTLRDDARQRAALAGLRHWAALSPRPRILVADASGGDESPFAMDGVEVLRVPLHPENLWLWQKEAMWNLAAKHLLDGGNPPDGLIFADLDVWWPDCPEIAALVADGLREHDFLQPFSSVTEVTPDGTEHTQPSYTMAKARGGRALYSGQGFVHAATARWWRLAGGYPDGSVEGGGDAVACLSWDAGCAHGRTFYGMFPDWATLVTEDGPRTPWLCLPVALRHEWHGERKGPGDTRHYLARHYVWEVCGGRREVVERDGRNGLWRWRDTPAARAARAVREHQRELATREAVEQYYSQALARENVADAQTPDGIAEGQHHE